MKQKHPKENPDGSDKLLNRLLQTGELTPTEASKLYYCCNEYYRTFVLLRQYDEKDTLADIASSDEGYRLESTKVYLIVAGLKQYLADKGENVENFGIARNDGAEKILDSIYQTWDGKELYPNLESKASHLFYFLIKDHFFVDGNKRIAVLLLLWFMDMNDMLLMGRDDKTLSYNTVYALAIFVAESSPKDKEIIVKLIHSFVGSYRQALPE